MARDLQLFEALETDLPGAAPTLRLYGWQPWAVSLGLHQDPARSLDLDAVARRGWDWVRRPTGGRAVLHADEITYALTAPLAGPFASGLADTHRRVAGALRRFYHGLGVNAELTRPAPPAALDPRITWSPGDDPHRTARATIRVGDQEAEAELDFDDEGRFLALRADRYRGGGPEAERAPWRVNAQAWRRFDGIEVPSEGDVVWVLPEGDFVFYRWTIEALETDVRERFPDLR